MARKTDGLDVIKMFSTLTIDHWRTCLQRAVQTNNIDKLVNWRYGMQVGLSDAVKKGVSTEKLEIWVMKRIRDLEKCARHIYKKRYPNPHDVVIRDKSKYVADALTAKKMRDKAFEQFLMRSNF
jgi:hypothetical protein